MKAGHPHPSAANPAQVQCSFCTFTASLFTVWHTARALINSEVMGWSPWDLIRDFNYRKIHKEGYSFWWLWSRRVMPGMDQLMGERRGTELEEPTHHPIQHVQSAEKYFSRCGHKS